MGTQRAMSRSEKIFKRRIHIHNLVGLPLSHSCHCRCPSSSAGIARGLHGGWIHGEFDTPHNADLLLQGRPRSHTVMVPKRHRMRWALYSLCPTLRMRLCVNWISRRHCGHSLFPCSLSLSLDTHDLHIICLHPLPIWSRASPRQTAHVNS